MTTQDKTRERSLPEGFDDLISIFSSPRPNGSPGEKATLASAQAWLDLHGIPHSLQPFTQYPYYFECIGLWLIFSRTILALAVWLRWGWLILPIALIGLAGGLLDHAFHIHTVTWPGKRVAQNILIEIAPPDPHQELVLCAHYDSKTEMLDHRQRMVLLYSIPFGMLASLILAVLGPLDSWAIAHQVAWETQLYTPSLVISLFLLLFAWALGLNLSVGRLLRPSQGSIDDGAACAILLALADRLAGENPACANTHLTIALFGGEEVNRQGSRVYTKNRAWPVPAQALNLEAMAQDGEYVYWERDGSIFGLAKTSTELNALLTSSITALNGRPPRPAGPVVSDGASFMDVGIPASTLGTMDSRFGESGFHRPTDNPTRIRPERLPQSVEILLEFLRQYDSSNRLL